MTTKEPRMPDVELKACPFCGAHDVRMQDCGRVGTGAHHGERVFVVGCYVCGAQMPGMYEEHGRQALIGKWNRRVEPQCAVPEGWKLVPETPTDEMLAAMLSEGEYGVLAQHSFAPSAQAPSFVSVASELDTPTCSPPPLLQKKWRPSDGAQHRAYQLF